MADNVRLNLGVGGDQVAADDIAGIKHQRVKIQHGADGSASDVSTASPLPVVQTSPDRSRAEVNFSTTGDHEIIAAEAAKKIRIFYMELWVYDPDSEGNVLIFKSASTTINGAGYPFEGSGLYRFDSPQTPLVLGTNEAFVINTSAAVQVTGFAIYTRE